MFYEKPFKVFIRERGFGKSNCPGIIKPQLYTHTLAMRRLSLVDGVI